MTLNEKKKNMVSQTSHSVSYKNPTPGYCDGIEYYNLDDQFRNRNFANDGTDELCDDTSVSESLQSPDWKGPSWYRCVLYTIPFQFHFCLK